MLFVYSLYIICEQIVKLHKEFHLIKLNKTFAEQLKGNFIKERAGYLFKDTKIGAGINIHQNEEDLNYNINQMLGYGKYNYNWIRNVLTPFPSCHFRDIDPLKETDYMKLDREGIKKLLELKNKVEDKMNEKFIMKGFKVKQINYLSYLRKIC